MARDFKRANKLAVISDLNVTPLIDLAFSLLIIFMITTPVIEQYNRIDLPNQPPGPESPPPEMEAKFITIDSEGSYEWGNDSITRQELESRLDVISKIVGEQPTIHIRADRKLTYQKVIDVVNMLKERNLTKLSLDTKAG
jgi:biopolymer transport protein ExbD